MATLTLEGGALVLRARYDQLLVNAIKALPAAERKYRAEDKAWLVAPEHGALVAQLVQATLGEVVAVPQVAATTQKQTLWLEVRYLGQTKERGNDERTAFAWVNNGWNAIFPEGVLREWFGLDPAKPDEQNTLYAVLGVKRTAAGAEIKTAFRKAARQWHPDVCKEPNAEEQFKRISEANEILSDPGKRAKYDAGLKLEASLNKTPRSQNVILETVYGYRSPLLCGRLQVEAVEQLGRYVVAKILAWDDIKNASGKVLVVSWPKGAQQHMEAWV